MRLCPVRLRRRVQIIQARNRSEHTTAREQRKMRLRVSLECEGERLRIYRVRQAVNSACRRCVEVPLTLFRSGGAPERARVDPVRIDGRHLLVQFVGGAGVLGEPVEVAYVRARLADDLRIVRTAGTLMSSYNRARVQRFDEVERS